MSLNVDDFHVLRRSNVPIPPPSGFDALYTKSSGLYIVDSSGNEYRVITANSSGWVGIGTTTPTTMLDVNGQIRIRGGSPGANKILISDENGFGSWSVHSIISHGSLSGLSNDDHAQYLTTGRHDTTARHGSSVVDHGSIGGLDDDDHTQYLNIDRHDTSSRHPIGTVVPHDNHSFLDGLGNDDHPQYLNITRHDMTTRHGSNVVDHGSIGGLGDDDHPQYLTNARHDTTTRHGSSVVDHGSIGGLGDDDHTQYLTNARHDTTARHGSGVVDHGSIGGLGDDDHTQYLTNARHDTTTRHTVGSVIPVVTSVGNPGSDSNIPTEKAVRSAINAAFGVSNASGSSTGTGSTQTIAHGLGTTPRSVSIVPTSSGTNVLGLYADSTNIYVSVTSGKGYIWSAFAW